MRTDHEQIRAARTAAGLTQAEVAARVGIGAANLAAYESGRRPMSEEMVKRILDVIRPLPSAVLRERSSQVVKLVRQHRGREVAVFGSVARGTDRFDSDIDLLVTFEPSADLFDQTALVEDLEALLGTKVDVVSTGGLTDRDDHIRHEAVRL